MSALTEKSMDIVGEDVAEEKPREAEVLADSRSVDDIGDSDKDKDTVRGLTASLDKIFASVGLSVKGWCMCRQAMRAFDVRISCCLDAPVGDGLIFDLRR